MGIEERKERGRRELRRLILKTAEEIVLQEGIQKLSIRKIAGRIEYSPSIVYHYFRDKDDIVNQIMTDNYKKILKALSDAGHPWGEPEERLKGSMRSYIRTALDMKDYYIWAQLNSSPEVLYYTASMFQGASGGNRPLSFLCGCLREIPGNEKAEEGEIELAAQMIVASVLGLIIKLHVEKDLDELRKERLIEYYINVTLIRMAGINRV